MISMLKTCQIVNALAGSDKPLNYVEIAALTGLTQDDVSKALPRLSQQGRLKKSKLPEERAFRYEYNEESNFTRSNSVKKGRKKSTKQAPKEARVHTPTSLRGKQIALLERLMKTVGPDDRDVLLGIIRLLRG